MCLDVAVAMIDDKGGKEARFRRRGAVADQAPGGRRATKTGAAVINDGEGLATDECVRTLAALR